MPRAFETPDGRRVVQLDDGRVVDYDAYAKAAAASPSGPRIGQMLTQGAVVRGPANLAGLGDLLRESVRSSRAFDAPMAAAGAPIANDPNRFANAVRGVTSEALGRAGMPVTAPQGAVERVAESVGAGITESLPTLALPGGPLTRAGFRTIRGLGPPGARAALAGATARNLAGGALSEVASTEVRAAGGGPAEQLVAALLAGASPNVVRGIYRGAAAIQPHVFPTKAQRGAIATKAAQRQIQQEIPPEVTAEAQQLLDAEKAKGLYRGFGERTFEQTVGDRFPGITGLARRVAADPKAGPVYRAKINDLEIHNAEAAKSLIALQLAPDAPLPPTVTALARRQAGMKRAVDTAFARAGDLQGLDDGALRLGAADVRLQTEPIATSLQPKEILRKIDFIRKRGTGVNLSELRQLDSLISRTWWNKGVPLALDEQRILGVLDDAVEKTYDEAARVGGAENVNALRKAIKLRRVQGVRFNPQDPLYQLLGGHVKSLDLDKTFGEMIHRVEVPKSASGKTKLPDPVTFFTTLKRTIGGDAKAWAGVQTLVDRQILGPDYNLIFEEGRISKGGAEKALANLRKFRPILEVVRGKGAADNARDFILRAEELGTGRIDLRQSAPLPMESRVREQTGTVLEVGTWNRMRAAIRAFSYVFKRLPKTAEEADLVFTGALYDKQIGRGFLEPLPPEQVEAWGQRIKRWTAASGRTLAEQVPRAAAGIGPPEGVE